MCLIIHREVGKSGRGSNVPNEVLSFNARINPDGFGIAWREDTGDLRSVKFGPHEYDQFHDLLKNIDRDNDIEYVAHFRKATHGPACTRLSHPFKYEDRKDGEVLVFHNGILSIDTDPTESDTSTFVNQILTALSPRWWANKAMKYLVEEAIGYSRFVIMTKEETIRLNPKLWDTENGIHYSTWPYPVPKKTTYSNWKGWKGSESTYAKPTTTGKVITIPAQIPATLPPTVDGSAKGSSLIGASGTDYEKGNGRNMDVMEMADDIDEWVQNGHVVSPLGEAKKDDKDDIFGTAVCEACHTIGDFYIIEGKVYLDVNHFFVDSDDEEAILAAAEREEEELEEQALVDEATIESIVADMTETMKNPPVIKVA